MSIDHAGLTGISTTAQLGPQVPASPAGSNTVDATSQRPARRYYEISPAESAHTLARIQNQSPATRRVLLRGATVVTMDARLGDLPTADLLIEGSKIVAVGKDLAATSSVDTISVDMAGMILMPGMIDSHRHCWQSAFRRLAVDADLDAYVATTHGGMALHYRPEDMYAGTLAACLGALQSGITTILDFSHNSRSREHSDAVFQAYKDAGIRAVHAAAAPNAGEWDHQWPEDMLRLRDEYCSSGSASSIRMGIDMYRERPVRELLDFARDNGFGVTFDGVHGLGSADEMIQLGSEGYLGPHVSLIHCNDMPDELWQMLAATGTGVTLAPTSDEQIGIADAMPPIQQALDHGIAPSLSVDVEISLAGDMYTQMRCLLATQRMGIAGRRYAGETNPPRMLTNKDVLALATANGAAHVGLGSTAGLLAPGFEADIVALRAEDLATMPLNNAIGTIVQGVDSAAVDTVIVAGSIQKWAGSSLYQGTNALRERIHASRDYLAAQSGWTVDPTQPTGNRKSSFEHLNSYLNARKGH
ncbi:amidohydrolase family protein [Paenarthrobacter sp. RAF54_2]|uniref:amidohydrolase family protein n=1 Tax=Paenarthrobacter sp. RAF54_2 TaxID=3233061 RepID=UPI003F98DFB9